MHRRILLLLLLLPLNIKAFEPDRDLRISLAKETSLYYKQREGVNRNPNDFRPFLYSAARVAKMFPMYPAKGHYDRMLRLFELGGLESFWTKNFIIINIPGAKYSNGIVKRVSVDFSAWGVNEDSINWTYEVASRIQKGKSIPAHIGDAYFTKNFRKMIKDIRIPKDLKLRKIDLSVAEKFKNDYYTQKRFYRDAEALRRVMEDRAPVWEENTQDDIDSTLIYRVLEELDRKSRNWSYGHQLYSPKKHALYNYLTQFIDEESDDKNANIGIQKPGSPSVSRLDGGTY